MRQELFIIHYSLSMRKQRLDILLTEKGLCDTRSMAQKLIRSGKVKVKQQIIDKPATLVATDSILEVAVKPPFVSRGGEKLAKALDIFPLKVKDRICLDGGISTGGFTDCLLQRGAKKVYGIDVGYGQVAWELRQNDKLILLERTNFRNVTPDKLYQSQPYADLAVMDLSFISLTKVMDKLWELLTQPRDVIFLVKPQFEVGKEKVGKNGVVRESSLRGEAIYQVLMKGIQLGWQYQGLTWSPIKGPAGNIEYLLWLSQEGNNSSLPTQDDIHQLTLDSENHLSEKSSY